MDQSTDRITATQPRVVAPAPKLHRNGDDANKPLHEIEADISRTRVRLSATIEALERELAPQRVVEKSSAVLRSALEPGPGPFRRQVWAYAVPFALIVSGLSWLFVLRRRTYYSSAPSGYAEMPAEGIETGETPPPAAAYADLAGPVEPVTRVDEKSAI